MIKIKQLKVLELFGGIGAIRKALIKQNIDYKIIDYIEIDKNCVKSYNALYGEDFKPKDIKYYHPCNIKVDLLMHGSPCQDFSRIGLKKGGIKESGTRSSLLFETIRIIKEMKFKPKIVLWENVKGVLDKKMRTSFFHYLNEMNKLGYQSKYKVLNAIDFGIPQKRERIFVISILKKNNFDFNKLEKLPLKDISNFLENEVSSIYEVSQKSVLDKINGQTKIKNFNARPFIIDKFICTISTRQIKIPNAGFIDLKNGKYRYLTEKECFRLMGFDDEDFGKLKAIYPYPKRKNTTSSILYKQAGNSIVVNVLEAILKQLYLVKR